MSFTTEAVPNITLEVACSGARHQITYSRGDLLLHDHDVDAEHVLHAFGARSPFCVRLTDACRTAAESPDALGSVRARSALSPWRPARSPNGMLYLLHGGTYNPSWPDAQTFRREVLASLPFTLRAVLARDAADSLDSTGPQRPVSDLARRRALEGLARSLPRHATASLSCWPAYASRPGVVGWLSGDRCVATAFLPFNWTRQRENQTVPHVVKGHLVLGYGPSLTSTSKRAVVARWLPRTEGLEGFATAARISLRSGRWTLDVA